MEPINKNYWMYIYKSGSDFVVLNMSDDKLFKGTYDECINFYNNNLDKVLNYSK